MSTQPEFTPTTSRSINKVKRMPERGKYDKPTIYKILDEGLVAHVGFALPYTVEDASQEPEDWPLVMPMAYSRIEDTVYLHGYISGRLIKALGPRNSDAPRPKVNITVTHLDGIVYAINPFHNSFNYRSACVFGYGRLVTDPEEKLTALKYITNQASGCFLPQHGDRTADRWEDSKPPGKIDLQSTGVIAVQIETASAKVRAGAPKDDKEDVSSEELNQKVWSGVLPIRSAYGPAESSDYTQTATPEFFDALMKSG
ncbi:hypothetical protein K493DRAFT_318705 [Basidiobolus meristosporus CBS 931.73]|uniref:Flavin-nucleotide-binding protein n=1 Tax=Basidiobolus meristosporus CBS 931.73 TaxID=1314790 RepID=A0A1Y1XUI5_9FUNG|nr:hypothetical protein K493DRAFT_318705 [Basidiobolus meristosporus CBS 931.73]|eukprot:ORX89410.1 hypothetical protein K493DRAFT_318705 [Basidiobolus meristosporus CBS 931.73]